MGTSTIMECERFPRLVVQDSMHSPVRLYSAVALCSLQNLSILCLDHSILCPLYLRHTLCILWSNFIPLGLENLWSISSCLDTYAKASRYDTSTYFHILLFLFFTLVLLACQEKSFLTLRKTNNTKIFLLCVSYT